MFPIRGLVPAAMRLHTFSVLAVVVCANQQIGPDTVTHVRSTLHTLLESVQREAHEADVGMQDSERWCSETLSDLRAVPGHTSEMQMDLREQEAAASEFQGLVTQVGTDIELTRRTINDTEQLRRTWLAETTDGKRSVNWLRWAPEYAAQRHEGVEKDFKKDSHAIAELLDAKLSTLSSLKAEHELVQLAYEEAQWQAAEMRRRLADRRFTVTAERGFFEMLAYGCRGHEMRTATSAAARAREASAAEHVISALGGVEDKLSAEMPALSHADAKPAAGLPAVAELSAALPRPMAVEDIADKDFELDFSQRAKTIRTAVALEDATSSLVGGDARRVQVEAVSSRDTRSKPHKVPTSKGQRMRVDFAQLKSEGLLVGERRRQCLQEQEHNYLVLRLAGDLVKQIGSEMDAHSSAEMHLQDGLKELDVAGKRLNSIVQHVTTAVQNEATTLARMEEDRKFTSGILGQAVEVFDGLEQSGNLTEMGVPRDIVSLLTSANVSCVQSLGASEGAHNEAVAVAMDVAAKAHELVSARTAEASEMQRLHDGHVIQQGALAETKKAYEAEVAQALAYLDKLKEECSSPKSAREDESWPGPNVKIHSRLRGAYTVETETEAKHLSHSGAP